MRAVIVGVMSLLMVAITAARATTLPVDTDAAGRLDRLEAALDWGTLPDAEPLIAELGLDPAVARDSALRVRRLTLDARFLHLQGDYPQALAMAELAIETAGDTALAVPAVIRRALALLMTGRLPEAEAALASVEDRLAARDPEPGLRAELEAARGALAFRTGRLADAERRFAQAAELYRQAGRQAIVSSVQLNRAQALISLGRVTDAEALIRQVKAEAGNQPAVAARVAMLQAQLDYNAGRIADAKARLTEAIALYRDTLHEYAALRSAAHNLGLILQESGDYESAREAFTTAQAAATQSGDTVLFAEALNNRGTLDLLLGHYRDALTGFEAARQTAAAVGDSRTEAAALGNLAIAYRRLNQPARALAVLDLAGARYAETGDLSGTAKSYLALGNLHYDAGRYAEAGAAFDYARQLADAAGDHSTAVVAWSNLAACLFEEGDTIHCRAIAADVLEAYWQYDLLGQVPFACAAYGTYLMGAGDTPLALARFREGLAAAVELRLGEEAWYLLLLTGRAHESLGDTDAALASYRAAVTVIEDLRGTIPGDDLRASYLANKGAVYEALVRLLSALGLDQEAFEAGERFRARALLDLFGNARLPVPDPDTRALLDEERCQARRLGQLRNDLRTLAPENPFDTDTTRAAVIATGRELITANSGYAHLLRRLEATAPELMDLVSVSTLTVEEVRALLPDTAILLSYLVTDDRLQLWLVSRTKFRAVTVPVTRRALEDGVNGFRELIAANAAAETVAAAARPLYDALVRPVAADLPAGAHLVFVPHGLLHYLPWGALHDGRRWLIERHPLSVIPSASGLKAVLAPRPGPAPATPLLALANPASGLPRLPYADREGEQIAAKLPGSRLLRGADATEAELKTVAGGYRSLHFACHGEYNREEPLASCLHLAPAGEDDGRLEVRELFGLRLDARLAVLSACETALGRIAPGDEVIGLTRGFFATGIPALVASLWRVPDRSTAPLMTSFYAALNAGADPADALREAQLKLLTHPYSKSFNHPRAWAGFELQGNWRR